MQQNLKNFLKELVDDMENNKLNDNEIKIIGEFYMNYKFKNSLDKQNNIFLNDKKYIKYLSLGWYIYSNILDEK
jgi:hypothetical protein